MGGSTDWTIAFFVAASDDRHHADATCGRGTTRLASPRKSGELAMADRSQGTAKPEKSSKMVEDETLFSADGLRNYMGKRAAAEALDDAKREEAQSAAKKALIDELMKPIDVTQDRRDRFQRRLK